MPTVFNSSKDSDGSHSQTVKRGVRLCKHDNLHAQTTIQIDCTIELIPLKQRRPEHS